MTSDFFCHLSIEDTAQVAPSSSCAQSELRCGHTSLKIRDVSLKIDQSLIILLHVNLQTIVVVVVLAWPAVPHNHVEDCLGNIANFYKNFQFNSSKYEVWSLVLVVCLDLVRLVVVGG